MKRIMFCCIIFGSVGLFGNNILLSVPRSGSHWLLYGVQFLTLEPYSNNSLWARGKNSNHSVEFANPFNLDIDRNLPPILIRTHSTHFVRNHSNNNKLILIVRNPLESLVSRNKFKKSSTPNQINKENLDYYLQFLRVFHRWKEKNRHMVYYEDLIEDPQRVFEEILVFLGRSNERVEEFFQDYEKYRQMAMNAYSNHFNYGAVSNGQTIYHSKKVSRKNASFVMKYLQYVESDIYFEYLSRYFN